MGKKKGKFYQMKTSISKDDFLHLKKAGGKKNMGSYANVVESTFENKAIPKEFELNFNSGLKKLLDSHREKNKPSLYRYGRKTQGFDD